jgi:hypothetical protein
MGAFHAMFSVALHRTGSVRSGATPFPFGPRQLVQSAEIEATHQRDNPTQR